LARRVTARTVTFSQAMAIAILQGVSELFPVSSLGHAVLIPALLHWDIKRDDPSFLAFIVVLHLGTAVALLAFYWREWLAISGALVKSVIRGKLSEDVHERTGWLVIIGTIPVGLLGLFFEKPVRSLFASTAGVACFLILNAGVMFFGEYLAKRSTTETKPLANLSFTDAVKVGFAQSLALLPGISRSGCSIVAGLLLKLSHEEAAHYGFLLATPVILLASVLEIPKLFAPDVHLALMESIAGGVLAAITAYVSVAFLTRYFRENSLRPFGWYCLVIGGGTLALTLLKVVA
jgi:undecaprenyl-diphosphatase